MESRLISSSSGLLLLQSLGFHGVAMSAFLLHWQELKLNGLCNCEECLACLNGVCLHSVSRDPWNKTSFFPISIFPALSWLNGRDLWWITLSAWSTSLRPPAGLESQLQILDKAPHTRTKGYFSLMTNRQRLTSPIQAQKVRWIDCWCMCNLTLSTLVSYRNVWSIWLLLSSCPEVL